MIVKKFFIILQVYFLLLNTVIANGKQNYQRHLDGVFSSLSASIMKIMFAELVKMQRDPLKNIVQFRGEKIRDYQKIYEQVKTYENEIKNSKITFNDNRIQISYKNEIFNISEIWLDGSIVFNDQKILWNPEKDTFEDLQKQFTSLYKEKNFSSHFAWFIPEVHAIELLSFMLAGFAITVVALLLIHFYAEDETINEIREYFNKILLSIKNSIKKCEDDLHDSSLLLEKDQMLNSYKNETIKFINFFENYESSELYKKNKKIVEFVCEVLKNRNKLWIYHGSIIEIFKEMCSQSISLESCLDKHKDLKLGEQKIIDLNRDNKKTIEPGSSYFDLYESIKSGSSVKQK